MLNILLRTLIVYALLVIAMRIGGKRQVGQLQLSELVCALLLSELAAMPIGHEEIPITFAVIPLLAVVSVEMIIAFAVNKSKTLRKLFDGGPSVIIDNGRLNVKEMERLRLGIEELMVEARLKGVSDIADLSYAILEENGELSVFKKSEAPGGIAHVLVSDGSVNEHALTRANITEATLLKKLEKSGATLESVLLYTVDDSGKELLLRKDGQRKI